MKKSILFIGVIIVFLGGISLYNYFSIIQPISSKINTDSRNDGISIAVHYNYYIGFNTLVYNLRNVSTDKAPADVFRVFLQTASVLKDKRFDKVELDYKGIPKFFINGEFFQQLGSDFGEQNPVYTIRTFPENLYNITGEAAYSKWEGGMLGVLNKQMDDFNDFNKKWYLDEMLNN